ncbi:LysR family transcriptional regulator [Francisellaceae bacterium]|nr:LysR family transcriptional regulator [Francisellaceae bacterium]
MNPNLSHFETFMVVAEKQSFSLAAQELYLTKAAISNAIKTLEAELKIPLFIRTTRQVSLTEEGEILYRQCEKLKEELNITRNIISHFHDKPQGKLRINCNSQLTETYLLPVLNKYMSLFPDVKIEVLIEERMPDFKNENIDIAVGVNWPAPNDIIARKIGTTRYILCASPAYINEYGIPTTLSQLTQHKFIFHTGRDKNNPIVSLKEENKQIKVNSSLSANNIAFMKKCVLSGYGITQFHDYVISNELQTGALIEILSKFLKPSEPLFLYYQKNRYVQHKVRQLVNLFMENDG